MVDDVRRRRCAPVDTWVGEGEARLMNAPREEKLALQVVLKRNVAKSIAYVQT